MTQRTISSFGFKYGGPNVVAGVKVLDVRRYLQRNPYRRKKLRELRGIDPQVAQDIEQTPGFAESFKKLLNVILTATEPVIWLGCTGGHHRSVYLADRIGNLLNARVVHRDINKR
jgi:UPF0042 nucleotide-binding protein